MKTDKCLELQVRSLIKAAVQKHRLGKLDEAKSIYRQILQIQPDCGVGTLSSGNRYNLIAITNLGMIFQRQGQLEEAVQFYQQAIRLQPDAAVYNNLGNVLRRQDKLEEAVQSYQQALSLQPDLAAAYQNLGNVLQRQDKLEEAVQSYQQAIRLQPDAAVYNNLGNVLQRQDKLEEAVQSYQQAIRFQPDLAAAYQNLGNVLQRQDKLEEAVQSYQQALSLQPDTVVYNNLGNILQRQDKLEEAVQSYQQALSLQPDAVVYNNLGNALKQQGQLEEAVESYQQALSLQPAFAEAQINLCMSQLPIIYSSCEEIKEQRDRYQQQLQKLAQSYQVANQKEREKAAEAVGSSQPFYLAYQGLNDRDLQQTYGEMICQLMSSRYPQGRQPIPIPTKEANEKIRVGFVSGFFRNHSNWKIPLKGWIENLDRNKFELFGYHTGSKQDRFTARAAQAFVKFIQGPLSEEKWCEVIRQDNLHVLIFPELGMDPITVWLGCLRLAPIQMTSWGHPDTSGLPTIDYYLSSELMEPENAQEHYTEKLVRLPNLSIHYSPVTIQPKAISKTEIGINHEEIMFWCCQSLFKYLPQHDDVFPRIAQELANCKFVFINHHQSEQVTEVFRQRLSRAFEEFELNYQDYCIFLPRLDSSTFAGTAAIADVFLDSIGWSGCNSSLEAINYDIPIVTWPGELMRGRHTLAMLKMMGVEEMIAASKDEYVRIAIRLGQDSQYRQDISQQVAENKYKLYGDRAPIRALEEFLLNAVQSSLDLPKVPASQKKTSQKERRVGMPTVAENLKLAVEHHQANRLAQAQEVYNQILEQQPQHPEALYGLGVLANQIGQYQTSEKLFRALLGVQPESVKGWFSLGNLRQIQGQLPEAVEAYQQALAIQPDSVAVHNNLGYTLQLQGKWEEALTCYQKALELQPDCIEAEVNLANALYAQGKLSPEKQAQYAEVNYNLGVARQKAGDLKTAVDYYRQAIRLKSDWAQAHYHLGNALKQQGQLEEAAEFYQQALSLQPDAAVYNNLGNVLQQQGQLKAAVECYQQAIRLQPDCSQTHYNLGNVLQQQGQLKAAVECYQQAIRLQPDLAQAHQNLGNVLQKQRQLEAAVECYQQAIRLQPDLAQAHYNLGNVLQKQGQLKAAVECYQQAIRLQPNWAQAKFSICMSQLPIIYSSCKEIKEQRDRYQQQLQKLAQSYQVANQKEREKAAEAVGSSQPFYLAYQGLNDRDLQQTYGEMICQLMSSRYPQGRQPIPIPTKEANEKIRVGFVSGFFRNHSNWKIPLKGWIENLDRNKFELFGYYTDVIQDRFTARAAQAFVKFIQGPLSVEKWCEQITKDNLHILIFPEFGMEPMTVKLACLRLAPIQMTSWGHPDTSGLPTIDYYLSSELMEPENAQEHYTEKLVRLPNLSIHYSPVAIQPKAISKTEIGINHEEIMFWCCQSLFKYLPQHDDVFPRIAQELANCKFVFINHHQSEQVTEVFRQRLSRAFEEFELNYQDYCIFLPHLDNSTFAGTAAIADVFLDSIGWSGCNSSLEAINYDIPIVTWPGELMRGRHTLAMLKMMGVEEMIAASKDEYVRIAIRLGQDSQYRQDISQQVAENKYKLYEDLEPIKTLENFLLNAVQSSLDLPKVPASQPHQTLLSKDWLREPVSQSVLMAVERTLGWLSLEEAALLYHLARQTTTGSIIEVGSYRGRSTVALSKGALAGGNRPIYAVEPHEEFEGTLGGQFGPEDRGAFYQTMLTTSSYQNVRLVNLSSEVIAPGWKESVSLLWIDGDHTYEGVRRDFDCWRDHLALSAYVAFDDAIDPRLGPHKLVGEITQSGEFNPFVTIGKVVVVVRSCPETTTDFSPLKQGEKRNTEFNNGQVLSSQKMKKLTQELHTKSSWRPNLVAEHQNLGYGLQQQERMKLALMFLTCDNHNQESIWNHFLEATSPKNYSVYCHPKFPNQVTQKFLKLNIIPENIKTNHADISLVKATILLLKYAYQDPENKYFILLSESCVPLYPFQDIFDFLNAHNKSYIYYHSGSLNEEDRQRWKKLEDRNFVSLEKFLKQHQWMILNRELVKIILQHNYVNIFSQLYAPDEHYFINLLNKINPSLMDKVINQMTTFVNWKDYEVDTGIRYCHNGKAYQYRKIRPKTYNYISTQNVLDAKAQGCLFFRKVSSDCDCSLIEASIKILKVDNQDAISKPRKQRLECYEQPSQEQGKNKPQRSSPQRTTSELLTQEPPHIMASSPKGYYSLINHQYQFIFFWNAKCGCSTIKEIFYEITEGKVAPANNIHEFIGHQNSHKYFVPKNHLENYGYYKKIIIVRDPWSRLVSFYINKSLLVKKDSNIDIYGIFDSKNYSFNELVHIMFTMKPGLFQHHLELQSSGIEDIEFDRVILLSEMSQKLPLILQSLGIDIGRLRSLTSCSNHTSYDSSFTEKVMHLKPEEFNNLNRLPSYHCFYNETLINMVAKIYERDILKFNLTRMAPSIPN